jgi:Ca-activated chloride channel family protein
MIATPFILASVLAQSAPALAPAEVPQNFATSTPEMIYNEGVAQFRAGELERARELFAFAAARGNAATAARSMYNRGTTRYAEAFKTMQGGETAPATPQSDTQQQTMAALEEALRELKDAARADPTNTDARANAELTHRVLKDLKQKQDQQKQDQQKQDQQKQDQQKQDQQKQDQQKQDQQKQDQQQQDQQQQDQQKQDQQQQDQQKQDQQKQDQPQQQSQAAKEQKPMSKQEVERLLQKIRDRERQRMLEKVARERARTQPAPKDW